MLEVAGEVESMMEGDWLSSSSLTKCGISPEPEAAIASCCSSVYSILKPDSSPFNTQ